MKSKARSPVHGRSRRDILSSLFTIIVFTFVVIQVIVHGGDGVDTLVLALVAALAVVPFLISRYRRRRDAEGSVDYPKYRHTGNEAEPLKSTLHRSLIRIESNWTERCEGLPGRLARLFRRRSQVIGFGTENEHVALVLSWDCRVTLCDGGLSKHDIDLDGPEEEMLVLLENARDVRSIPGSIRVRGRGRDPRPEVDYMVRDTVAKLLRTLFR